MNVIHDEHKDDLATVLEADFVSIRLKYEFYFCHWKERILKICFFVILHLAMQYHANELLPLKDELVIEKVMSYLSKCIKDLESANVVDKEIGRFPKRLTHFFPGELLKACH